MTTAAKNYIPVGATLSLKSKDNTTTGHIIKVAVGDNDAAMVDGCTAATGSAAASVTYEVKNNSALTFSIGAPAT